MSRGKRTAVGAVVTGLGVGLAFLGTASSAEAASSAQAASPAVQPAIDWQPCPQYSDAVLQYLNVKPADMAAWRANWARTDCGTISVPLDYEHPKGRHITVALTRLRAKDEAHRLGSLAMNPGGPGGSGYLMPARFMQENPSIAALDNLYDLIGFDPRGVGYSTGYDCAPSGPPAGPPPVGRLTEAEFKQLYDGGEKDNAACSSSNPEFLRRLTTANVARDLDQIRRGLGRRR